jgi:hypothetical protein
MQQKYFKKLPHQECHISNPFQQILPRKRLIFCLLSNLEGILNFKFQIL